MNARMEAQSMISKNGRKGIGAVETTVDMINKSHADFSRWIGIIIHGLDGWDGKGRERQRAFGGVCGGGGYGVENPIYRTRLPFPSYIHESPPFFGLPR